ncbi:thioredoxin family protein [Bacteroidota bacterium]
MGNIITKELISKGYTYSQYKTLIDSLLNADKTTGDDQSESKVNFTKINMQRMKRLHNTTKITEELKKEIMDLKNEWIWLVITEAWCGDAAQNNPVIAKIAEINQNIDLKFILRDENPDVMNAYLTNGNRSIPKLICLDSNILKEIGTWGPRPEAAQKRVMKDKADPNVSHEEMVKNNQLWYLQDKTLSIQNEFIELIKKWKKKSPDNST